MASSVETTVASITENITKKFTFGTVDYIVFVLMLCISAGIGVYFGFFSKSKNTTDEYLMGSKKMKTIPIAISLVASQLSGIAIMSVPAEVYSYGFTYFFMVLAIILMVPILNYIIVPVFYNNNISNCYEYLEMRFNKRTRQVVTAAFILNACLMLPVYMFIPSLAFSQVSGINIHLINTVVCSICVFYTMLGGIKAVVWTDVVQAGIMISSVVLVGVLGTLKVGGLDKVLENASEGGRMDMNYSMDPRVRSTFWNLFCGGLLMWTGHIGLNQSCVQRIVSLPSLNQARKALILVGFGVLTIMGFNAFIGIVMFARYFGCDPILGGVVEKADKMMPFFVQDVMGHMLGMPGIFISCVFSAALSTMSAMLNSLAGVVYFDYIKPFIRHTDERANNIMKIFVVIMGGYCILGGIVVQKFNSIIQTINTIQGINIGAVVGIFLVGMFVPRVNGKVACLSIAFSVGSMLFIIINAQMRFKTGDIKYEPLSTTLDRCEDFNFNHLMQNGNEIIFKFFNLNPLIILSSYIPFSTPVTLSVTDETILITTAFSSNRDFSIYEISFYWYKLLGASMVFLSAIPLSYIWKRDKEEKQDPKLYSPFVKKFLSKPLSRTYEEVPLKTPLSDNGHATINITGKNNGNGLHS
ncbi:LOW QUALITY PROTEIN: sodium-coupled monocarboxylate transporter 1-like [Cochliomyia hominivorax]